MNEDPGSFADWAAYASIQSSERLSVRFGHIQHVWLPCGVDPYIMYEDVIDRVGFGYQSLLLEFPFYRTAGNGWSKNLKAGYVVRYIYCMFLYYSDIPLLVRSARRLLRRPRVMILAGRPELRTRVAEQ